MTGSVMVVATSKGGAGKSTLVACLATLWHDRGRQVNLVDADPNQTLSRWHAKGGVLSRLPIFKEADETELIRCIGDAAKVSEVTVVDCPGVGNQIGRAHV